MKSSYVILVTCFLYSVYLSVPVSSITLDNEVIGVPEIQCTEDMINFTVRTRNPFRGNIYVRGQFGNPKCKQQYYSNNYPEAMFNIKIGECGMSRIRQLQPHGMNYMLVFVTNFHPSFVTKIDRAYNVRCFYAQQDKTVNSELEVSGLATEEVAHSAMLMPHCEYSVRRQTVDGQIVRSVNVGDPIVHLWECDNSYYGMLVKNCEIKDGNGFTKQVLDEKGCPIYSPEIFGHLTYDSELRRAFISTLAYKLPDVNQLFFECQIQVCNKRENECDGITPPSCQSSRSSDFDLLRPNVDPTPFYSSFERHEKELLKKTPAFIPSLGTIKPESETRRDDRISSNIAFPNRDSISNEIPVERTYPRIYPERTVILQAHQQPYFRKKDSPTPTESNEVHDSNIPEDWAFWRNSTPLILKRSSRASTPSTKKSAHDEKVINRIRRAEDETMDVINQLAVYDKDFEIPHDPSFVYNPTSSSQSSHEMPICLDKAGLGILIGCFAFLSTVSFAMTTYIIYDICFKRRKQRKGIITSRRTTSQESTDTESLNSAGSRGSRNSGNSNPTSSRNLVLPRLTRVEPGRNMAFEKY